MDAINLDMRGMAFFGKEDLAQEDSEIVYRGQKKVHGLGDPSNPVWHVVINMKLREPQGL